MSQLNLITISLSLPHPDSGMVPAVSRITGHDRAVLELAADRLGLNKSALMRILIVRGAERILQELGVELTYEQNEHVDLSKGETLIE